MSHTLIERVRFGHGRGSLARYSDSPNWIAVYSAHGREHRESTHTPDLKVAKRFHKQKLDELAADRQGLKRYLPPLALRVTVNGLLDDYAADVKLRGLKSEASLLYHMKNVRATFGPMRAADVAADANLVDRFIAVRLKAGAANATVNRQTTILGAAFKLAKLRGKVTAVPTIRRLAERNVRRGFFERNEFALVLQHLPDYLADAATFGYLCGWRRSEITGLRWEWVQAERADDGTIAGGTVILPDSKNGRGRVLALTGDLPVLFARRERARLVEVPGGEPRVADLVFHRQGQPLGDFRRAWHAALTAAGFSHQEKDPATGEVRTVYNRCFHDMRRSAVRNLIRAGVRETVAMAVSGHRTRSVFDRYNVSSVGDLEDAMERVARDPK
jgi:integrase